MLDVCGAALDQSPVAHAVDLVENAIVLGELAVARRRTGCVRFSWVEPGSCTPRRFRCQPETAVAALGTNASTAAVASELAGQLYRIPALRERIEDYANNVTRFLVIGRRAAGRTGRDKTSILFSIRDEVGTLHRILEPFASARLSLTKIESRPTRRRPWEYVFFVDFEGHRDDPVAQGVLAAVRERRLGALLGFDRLHAALLPS